ncbi:MAG: T9SS type A sorting domain-containing protein [Taibaiella sp.]|nr:T9SS type A sorting domain-containing protein [Taibaiella sp.]
MNKTFNLLAFIAVITLTFTACKKKAAPISVYPNPATTYIIFDATSNTDYKNGEITVKDVQGNIIKVFRTKDSSRIQWQIDTFDRGLYHYSYTADKMKTQTGKIVFN